MLRSSWRLPGRSWECPVTELLAMQSGRWPLDDACIVSFAWWDRTPDDRCGGALTAHIPWDRRVHESLWGKGTRQRDPGAWAMGACSSSASVRNGDLHASSPFPFRLRRSRWRRRPSFSHHTPSWRMPLANEWLIHCPFEAGPASMAPTSRRLLLSQWPPYGTPNGR